MRVVAGSAGGTRLARVPGGVRPLSDRAREGLFSSLGGVVGGAALLDLFAGTGALGIEALSRGAVRATFVDRDAAALRAIRENLERTGLADRSRVVRGDVGRFLSRNDKTDAPYDLVFLDPPHAEAGPAVSRLLASLVEGWLAHSGWRVVLTRGPRSSTPVIPLDWRLARRLAYGESLVSVYREV